MTEDREEFQDGPVSKKEVTDLWTEVYNSIDWTNDPFLDHRLDLRDLTDFLTMDANTPKQMLPDQVQNLDDSLITPIKDTEQPLATPDASKNHAQPTDSVSVISPISSRANISYFDPSIISTPAKSIDSFSSDSNANQNQQQNLSCDSFNSILLSTNESATQYSYTFPYPMNTNSFSPLESKSPILNPITTSHPVNNHQLPYSPVPMPSESSIMTLTSAMPPTVISSIQSIDSNESLYLKRQIEAGPAPKKARTRAKRTRFKSAAYNELQNFDPSKFPPQVSERTCLNRFEPIIIKSYRIILFSTFINQTKEASPPNNATFWTLNSECTFNWPRKAICRPTLIQSITQKRRKFAGFW